MKNKQYSKRWKHWATQDDPKACVPCITMHGKIFPQWDILITRPPLHPFCRCKIIPMEAITAGYATQEGTLGADYWIKNYKQLPVNYIQKSEARIYGWKASKGNLSKVLPGKSIGGDRFFNDDGHLPDAPNRLWYEADINYSSGHRGNSRLLYSNDGLVFATYDHYKTYIEIIQEFI